MPRVPFNLMRDAVEAAGHKLAMQESDYTSASTIAFYCRCGNTSVSTNTLRRIQAGAACSACRFERAVKTKRERSRVSNAGSTDPAVVRGNVLAVRKKDHSVIAEHAREVVTASAVMSMRNTNRDRSVVQFAEIVLGASGFNDGWVYVWHPNPERRYFANQDGRFASAKRPLPTMETNREFRNEYPQIKLDGKMVYIHREFAIDFFVVDTSTCSPTGECFERYPFAEFRDKWLESASDAGIDRVYIDALREAFSAFKEAQNVLMPTLKLQADHTVPNSRELFTAVRLVPAGKHVRDTIARGERKDAKGALLFDASAMRPVLLRDHENKMRWDFPSVRSLGEAIYRTNGLPIPETPANLPGPSLREKAIPFFEKSGNAIPNVIDSIKNWRYPILAKITGKEEHMVITPAMLWSYVKDKPDVQEEIGLTKPVAIDTAPKKRFGEYTKRSEPVDERLLIHPSLPFGVMIEQCPKLL